MEIIVHRKKRANSSIKVYLDNAIYSISFNQLNSPFFILFQGKNNFWFLILMKTQCLQTNIVISGKQHCDVILSGEILRYLLKFLKNWFGFMIRS